MGLYQRNGYIDISQVLSYGLPFNFIVGGRGTGKTFGALKFVIENKLKFVLMRRTQSQVDLINKPDFSPFKAVNEACGFNIGSAPISKYNVGWYEMINEDGKAKPTGAPYGYTMALSTISNLRGFDASDVQLIIYDEFIPERHERPIKEEGAAFLNAYETINRNREFSGKKPVQVLCLANANDLGNALFMELKLINKAEQMRRKGQEMSIDQKRGIGLFILNHSPISDKKKNTALYKITEGSAFEDMALNNQFVELSNSSIKSMPLAEFRSIVGIGEITIYKHKDKSFYYISTHRTGSPQVFGVSDTERQRFWRLYYWIWDAYMQNKIVFEDSTSEVLLTKYIN